MAKLVSKVYGDALFEVAVESGRLDEIWEQTRAMQTALEENPELFALMRHPKIVKEEKVKIIESIFTDEVCAELVGLLRMIVEKDHFAQIGKVLAYFDDQVKEYKSIGTAYVTTAMELSDAQKAAVLCSRLNREITDATIYWDEQEMLVLQTFVTEETLKKAESWRQLCNHWTNACRAVVLRQLSDI